jgi:hypothetical protein
MTEAEWQACNDPRPVLEFLRGKASRRKLNLFACACCRHVEWSKDCGIPWIDADSAAVALVERFADGQMSPDELEDAGRG